MLKTSKYFIGLVLLALVSFHCVNTKEKNTKTSNNVDEQKYLEIGKGIASNAQAVLGKNLMDALAKGEPEYALEFCNSKAIPITDSMAVVLKTTIKRVSVQARNKNNKANKNELSVMLSQKEQIRNGQTPKPAIVEKRDKMVAYFPIVTNAMCMQCHGKANQGIQQKTIDKIKTYYPSDQAMGYEVNELRGIWVVEMKKTK